MMSTDKNKRYLVNEVDHKTWVSSVASVQSGNFLQTECYWSSKSIDGWGFRRLLVIDGDGQLQGCALVGVKTFLGLISIGRLNRGPLLWTSGNDATGYVTKNVYSAIYRWCLRKRILVLFHAPETGLFDKDVGVPNRGVFELKNKNGWGSIRLDITPDADDLMAAMAGKWRNMLRKGIKLNDQLCMVNNKDDQRTLFEHYYLDQQNKGYVGVPKRQLDRLVDCEDVLVLKSIDGTSKLALGFIVIALSYDTGMYYVGWTSDEGRKKNTSYALLWEAINILKNEGYTAFDMGGVTINTPSGIRHFKQGIGGDAYENVPERVVFTAASLFG